jgi:transposase
MSATITRLEPDALTHGIFVGIDPGLDKHGYAVLVPGRYRLDRGFIPNTISGMHLFSERLEEWRRQCGGRLTIAMEDVTAYGEGLACYLNQAGYSVVVVSPLTVSRAQAILGPDANDLVDGEAAALCVMIKPELGRPTQQVGDAPESLDSSRRELRRLSRRHARWTKEHNVACNELHAVLRMAWLADYQRFFSVVDGAAALACWQEYPTPAEASQASPKAIAALIHQASHGRLKPASCHQKARDIRNTARLLVTTLGQQDSERWSGWAEEIRLLAEHLAELNTRLRNLKKQMAARLQAIGTPLTTFKGLGTVTAAAIEGESLGIHRFSSADRFARYNGTAPREDSSGRRPKHVKNRSCNRRLRQALMQLALNAPRYHPTSQNYLDKLQKKGITGGAARIRLARRLSDVIYAMLRDKREYSLEYHILTKRPAA